MIFPEAVGDLETYKKFREAAGVPILANITEFGKTPLFSVTELRGADVDIVLYPLSAFRAMNKAAELVYKTIRGEGTQKNIISHMQTRDELYQSIDYYRYESELDKYQEGK
jgi:methylisocitrate lyase